MRIFIIIFVILSGCSILENEPVTRSNVSINLGYLINPVGEDEVEYTKANKVCDCVDTRAKATWMPEKYLSFSLELERYAAELMVYTDNFESTSDINNYPKTSDSLTRKLESLVDYVIKCEELFDVRVEF